MIPLLKIKEFLKAAFVISKATKYFVMQLLEQINVMTILFGISTLVL